MANVCKATYPSKLLGLFRALLKVPSAHGGKFFLYLKKASACYKRSKAKKQLPIVPTYRYFSSQSPQAKHRNRIHNSAILSKYIVTKINGLHSVPITSPYLVPKTHIKTSKYLL